MTDSRVSCNWRDLTWEQCREAFDTGGSLLDICVLGTTVRDWDCILDLVRSSTWSATFSVDKTEQPLPETAQDLFSLGRAACLSLNLGCVSAYCHFFQSDEIELDIDPREVQSQNALHQVLELIAHIGQCVGKEVILTDESFRDCALIRYQPSNDTLSYELPRRSS